VEALEQLVNDEPRYGAALTDMVFRPEDIRLLMGQSTTPVLFTAGHGVGTSAPGSGRPRAPCCARTGPAR